MIKEDVTQVAELLGLNPEIVEASDKEGTLSARLRDVLTNNFVTKTDVETLKKNYKTEIETGYFNDLVEKAKKQDIPTDLYKPIKGAALQQTERELSQKFGVTDYSGILDLVEKAVSKTSANGKTLPEYETKIEELKKANLTLQQQAEEAVKTVETKYKAQSIERELSDTISKVPFDFSGHKPTELESAKQKTQQILKSVFNAEMKMDFDDKGRLVVIDKEGKVKRNTATLDPISPLDVMVDLAKEYNLKLTSPDRGGQGGNSSQISSASFDSYETYLQWCKSNNYNEFDTIAVKAWKASGLNKK